MKSFSVDGIGAQETNFAGVTTKLANEKIDAMFLDSIPLVSANSSNSVRLESIRTCVSFAADRRRDRPFWASWATPGKAPNNQKRRHPALQLRREPIANLSDSSCPRR